MAWFFAVSSFCTSLEEWSVGDVLVTLTSSVVTTGVMFGLGAKILHHFIG
ncbi:membrane protein [Pectobacterium phage vB_PatP_CB4]|nr:membrane protein [Pectobacterium phage vB_PatP_CB4]AQT27892.1 putative membrane protein [Pectobacterium phage vB_PatP_CB4]